VYQPEISNILGCIEDGIADVLAEPYPMSISAAEKRFAGYANGKLHKAAIYDYLRLWLRSVKARCKIILQNVHA
jgi:hypothetical protein